jgi:SAM-dependent methyltransferase
MRGSSRLVLVSLLAWGLGRVLGLSWRWFPFLLGFPWVLVWLLLHPLPGWVWPGAFLLTALVFGGGILTRVPLYHSNRETWKALETLLPETPAAFVDLGAGLGGPLAHLARKRPDCRFAGVEASPLTWLGAWLRALPCRDRCRVRLGSLWTEDLAPFDVVYAFLSPVPMERLFAKALRDMKPGSLFVSHSFPVPGRTPDRELPVPGPRGSRLLIWRMPGDPDRNPR